MDKDTRHDATNAFKDSVAREKQKFWDLESSVRNISDSATGSKLSRSFRGQYISLFLLSFVTSIALSGYVLFYIVGTQ